MEFLAVCVLSVSGWLLLWYVCNKHMQLTGELLGVLLKHEAPIPVPKMTEPESPVNGKIAGNEMIYSSDGREFHPSELEIL